MHTSIGPADLLTHIYACATDFAIFTVDLAGVVTSWNAGAEAIFGYSEQEMIGREHSLIFTPEDRALDQPRMEMQTADTTGKAADYRWHLRKDGCRFWADGVMTPLCNDAGTVIGYLKILKDITEKKLAQDKIARLSAVDPLTGLANRASFDARMQETLAICARGGGQTLQLLLIDLDHFKEVNDTQGHPAGDELLRQVAGRLIDLSRESDYIGRLGGDEFGVLQIGVHDPSAGGTLVAKIIAALAKPFQLAGAQVQVSASVGIAACPDDSTQTTELLKKADLALYKAKQAGRNGYHHFTDELDRVAHKRNIDSDALRRTVAEKHFTLVYQPIIDCQTGHAISMEALIRFQHPVLASYPVDYVIELATELGLIFDIGAWVFSEACMQLVLWKKAGVTGLTISVNTCARELQHDSYLSSLVDSLAASGVRAEEIDLELTERDAIDLNAIGSGVLGDLVSAGFRLSLDDFGVGYSSLSYLRTLPVSTLKLDKTFLRDIPSESGANAVAKAVIALANDLNLQVIAEGVEEEEQAQFLQALDCDALQGYFFSSAMPGVIATDWLLAQRGHSTHH